MSLSGSSIKTFIGKWLPPKIVNPPLSPTTSEFGRLDEDALLLIAHHLVPLPTESCWNATRRAALQHLSALAQSCRFWRDAFSGVCQVVRLEAFALASPCVAPPFSYSHRPNGSVGALFELLLAQAVHALHVAMLRRAAGLMITHCTNPHCSDSVRALRNYDTNAFHIDEHSDFKRVTDDVDLTRYALRGECVQMHVAMSGSSKYGILASQGARGEARGGVLLVAAESATELSATCRRPSRSQPVVRDPVFTYVESAKSRVFSPDSELKKSAAFRPGGWVLCAAVCGDVAVLCQHTNADRSEHAIHLWSVKQPMCPRLSTGPPTLGHALAVWAYERGSSKKGDYLEIYTLVQHHHGVGTRNRLHIRVVRYARATSTWSGSISKELHLGAEYGRGHFWRYPNADEYGRYRGGVSLNGSVQVATESPVTSAALTVTGMITRINPALSTESLYRQSRVLVVDRVFRAGRTGDSFIRTQVITEREWPLENENVTDATLKCDPDAHLSRCGTVLVVLYLKRNEDCLTLELFRRDPELTWILYKRHTHIDLITQGVSRLPPKNGSMVLHHRESLHWGRAHIITSCHVNTKNNQTGTSAFSPCGKFLALLSRGSINVIDVHESICLNRLNVHCIFLRVATEPYAIAWPDGLFIETSSGIWQIGNYKVPAPP